MKKQIPSIRDNNGEVIKKEKQREIKIAAHWDAAIYAYYADQLTPVYEKELEIRDLGNVVNPLFPFLRPALQGILRAG